MERKIKSSFLIYADFESILVPEDLEESCTSKYKNMLLAFADINSYVFMISLVSILSQT